MIIHDKASELSLRYLATIEKRLHITWNAQEQPVCIIDWIDTESIHNLRKELVDLLSGTLSEEARQATEEYGKAHIQTVGFGHASDFDQFIKLGFIYGERVVLWDVISSRLLLENEVTPRLKNLVAQTACNLLLLRPVVEQGGLVILPHPARWSSLAENVEKEMHSQGNKSTAALGLSMALAAIEEGLPLHPYTLLISGSQPAAHEGVSTKERDLYSAENYIFHSAISSLLKDQRVAYLQGVSAADFYQVVSQHTELQRALRKHFLSDLKGLSPQQAELEVNHLTNDLIALIGKRNAALIDYAAEGGEATASLLLTSIVSFTAGLPALDALAVGAIAVPLLTAVRKWIKTPEKSVIVQAFQELQEKDTQLKTPQSQPINVPVTDNIEIHASIYEIYQQFMSFHWTESRHHFLESLSPQVAKELLKTLEPDDIEVIVNYRKFQEAYIGDYLAYLWELDEDSFWEHIGKTFESPDGMLLYDLDDHIQVMRSYDMPLKVWNQLLNSLLSAYRTEIAENSVGYPLDILADIIRFQTEEAPELSKKREALIEWFKPITGSEKESVTCFLDTVYRDEMPQWFVDSVSLQVSP
ncbi:hypothetical protein [Geobacter sulfurreducens]|uniref:hypothetical protein n=1 Tax=Geobacter sulfurreducens TaxID=35554 RepID=UPI002C91CE5C|nr:hypothetical protein [Geobacter sulfurreducens]HML78761.1 hypothetical protein [Geobacter sulfurreducens]